MMGQVAEAPLKVESTYKAREVEGIVDLYFYRRVGFVLASFFHKLKMSPAGVSLLGAFVGVVAGHLYYYRDLRLNAIGIILHICANACDNADGQLARITGQQSRKGRLIDAFADHLVWVSIYVHLTLRYLLVGVSPAICLLAIGAAISHNLQKAAVDYYRGAYLYFVRKKSRADWDSVTSVVPIYRQLRWRDAFWDKILLYSYLNFTRQQEALSKRLKLLRNTTDQLFGGEIPSWFQIHYRERSEPMLKWWGLLMTNSRMLVLLISLLASQPVWYFWIELIPLNLLLAYLIFRQEKMAQALTQAAGGEAVAA
jgi:hypothetical protein